MDDPRIAKGHAESPRSRDMLEVEWIIPQSFVLDWNRLQAAVPTPFPRIIVERWRIRDEFMVG